MANSNVLVAKNIREANAAGMPGVFERMKQQIWQCLENPRVSKIGILKLERAVGSVADKMMRKVIEEADQRHLFDITARVAFESRANMKEIIWAALGFRLWEFAERERTGAFWIYLRRQKYLLILDNVREPLNIEELGIDERHIFHRSKIVIVTTRQEVCSAMKIAVVVKEAPWESLSEEDAWDSLWQEASDVADKLVGFRGSTDVVIECWLSCLISPYDFFSLVLYWNVKGFTRRREGIMEELDLGHTLFIELERRHLLVEDYKGIRHPHHILSKITDIVANKSPKILAKSGLGLRDAPKFEEWEDREIISLSRNEIESLCLLPSTLLLSSSGQQRSDPNLVPKCPSLTTLLLDTNPLREIPASFFEQMSGLQILDLSYTQISLLPSSMSYLCNLRLLRLQYCPKLEFETFPPPQIQSLTKLEVLDLEGTPAKTLISKAPLEHLTNLHFLSISMAASNTVTELSLRGCRYLGIIDGIWDLKQLQVLDLSGTKIREFPYFIKCMSLLTRLDMLDTKRLTIVEWKKMKWLPKVLNWDQCCLDSPQGFELRGSKGYCISVSDPNIFRTLDAHSALWIDYFQEFNFYVHSCEERREHGDNPPQGYQFHYSNIYNQVKMKYSDSRNYDKCLKIHDMKSTLEEIRGALYNTQFFSLYKNQSIRRLSNLGIENMKNLIECQIEKCHAMNILIYGASANTGFLNSLQYPRVFDLGSLKTLRNLTFRGTSFQNLTHLYLGGCPRILNLFPSNSWLGKLNVLEIKFCGRLERVFQRHVGGQDEFPSLHTLHLWELPKLQSICNGHLPNLKEMKTKGCPKLQNVPIHSTDPNTRVHIIGEMKWWRNLIWEDLRIQNHICFHELRPFAIESLC